MAHGRRGFGFLLIGLALGFGLAQCVGSEPSLDRATSVPSYEYESAPRLDVQEVAPPASSSPPSPPSPPSAPLAMAEEGAERLETIAAPPNTPAAAQDLPSDAEPDAPATPELVAAPISNPAPAADRSRIRRLLVQQSVSNYSGSCACPYNVDRAGRTCGRRSAYSRPGGASPICYPEDVSDEDVERFVARSP